MESLDQNTLKDISQSCMLKHCKNVYNESVMGPGSDERCPKYPITGNYIHQYFYDFVRFIRVFLGIGFNGKIV